MPTLNSEEYQYEDSGVLLNGNDSALPFVDISSIEGLDSAPVRQQTHDMEGQDGGYVDSDFETMRTVTLEGTIYASATAFETYLDSLKANFAPTPTVKPLYIGTDAQQRVVFGKSQGLRYSKDSKRRLGIAEFQVQIICEDPRIYSDELLQTSGSFGSGSITLTLSGNRTSAGKIRLVGPVTNPTITHTQSGGQFVFSGYTLSTGDELIIDLFNRTAIEEGTISRRNLMTVNNGWYLLRPGDNTFTYSSSSGSGSITVEARSAWR